MKKITFHSYKTYNDNLKKFYPEPAKKNIPEWFSKADRLDKDINGNLKPLPFGGHALTFKACPALVDFFVTGYMLLTPCDIYVYKKNDMLHCIPEKGFEDFCIRRQNMNNFPTPYGYYDEHYSWYPNWMPEMPKGYSALYFNPINRFDLPFITVSGIIDNDKIDTPGLIPFFINKEFTGTIPAGTPYVQIVPIKREDWSMEIKFSSDEEIKSKNKYQESIFRVPEAGGYKKHIWERKNFF